MVVEQAQGVFVGEGSRGSGDEDIEVDSDVVIPPFSAKVSRTILIKLLEKIEPTR